MTIAEKKLDRANETGTNQEGRNANIPVRVLSAKTIINDDIKTLQGEKVGVINDIVLNVLDGKVEYIVVEVGGVLGIGGKYFAVPYHSLKLDAADHSYVIQRDINYLRDAPGFDKDHWPATNDHYYENTHQYWANTEVTPGSGFTSASTVHAHSSTPTTDSPLV